MAELTYEQRIISRIRSIYSGRRTTKKWCAESCGIPEEEFEGYYQQYMGRLYFSLREHEWFICKEWEYLILSGYMRPDEVAKRFLGSETPENIARVEKWIEEQGGINPSLSWRDMRVIRTLPKREVKQNEDPTEQTL